VVASEYAADFVGHLPWAGRARSGQSGEHRPHLRHRQRRRFFPSCPFARVTNHRANSDSVVLIDADNLIGTGRLFLP
jgi:hypothetical protein